MEAQSFVILIYNNATQATKIASIGLASQETKRLIQK
jgi:hypothetical protein